VYLTAQQAADRLGVSVSTLYAYVGRKQIRTQRVPRSKSRLYWSEDIERLSNGSAPPTADVLVPETSITLITPQGPFYRGQSAIALAETETLESVCHLLWGPPAEGAFGTLNLKSHDECLQLLRDRREATVLPTACALLPMLEQANPRAHDLTPAGYCRSGAEIVRWFAAVISGGAPSDDPIHETIAKQLGASPAYADLIRRLLVLSADHELDPSTYAVRAVANTGVSAYQLAISGLASAGGRRLTFGRAGAISQMMGEIIATPDPAEVIQRRLREGESVYGFGSRVYGRGDPRAAALLQWIRDVDPDDPDLKRLDVAIAVAEEAMDRLPDFVLPLSFVAHKLGVPRRAGYLLRLARIGGWIAHAIEQGQSPDIVRPRTSYVGVLPDQSLVSSAPDDHA
jgi:citrate synthase